MLGNVKEWTNTPNTCRSTAYTCTTPWDGRQKIQSLYLRGLAWTQDQAPITEALPADPFSAANDIGFRCAGS